MTNLNILNAKALEKQIKILETRIAEVQGELDGLEKMRTACLILLGNDVDFAPARVEEKAEAAAPPKKAQPAPKGKPTRKGNDSVDDEPETESHALAGEAAEDTMETEAEPLAVVTEVTPEGAADAAL